jgi:hypothetical protein
MIVIVKGIGHTTIWVELTATANKDGKALEGSNEGISIKAFLRTGQQFLTENDIIIEGQVLTTVEDVTDQVNEYLEEDF